MANMIVLLGRVGRNAELKYFNNGSPVAEFSLAVNESWKDQNGVKQERTDWFDINITGKRAETLAPWITKGRQIAITGKINSKQHTNKDGLTRTYWTVRADEIEFINDGSSKGLDQPAEDTSFDFGDLP